MVDDMGTASVHDVDAHDVSLHGENEHATRLESEAFPYEAQWRSCKQRTDATHDSKVAGWAFFLVFAGAVLAVGVWSVRLIVGKLRVLQADGDAASGAGGATGISVSALLPSCLPLLALIAIVVVAVVEVLRSVRGDTEAAAGGNAITVYPDPALIAMRQARCAGNAFPLVSEGIDDESAVSPAWRVPGAGPLWSVSGRIVDTLALDACYATGSDAGDERRFPVHFALVECLGVDGELLRCWSNAMPGCFAPGQRVAAYLYLLTPDGARPFLRVHDVADASQAVSVANHQAAVFSPELAERWADAPAGGLPGRDNTYGVAMAARPYGKTWRENVTAVGYRSDRTAKPGAAFGGDGGDRASVLRPAPVDDLRIGDAGRPGNAGEAPRTIAFRALSGVVEDVVVVPLFNRRFWCGFGYMALVRFSRMGSVRREWAFCDPGRADSYLGDDAARLRVVPVGVGDRVTLWRAWDGLCVVEPRG
ncbi:hypothetical protein [Pseudoscardovia radai]|uniref:hypothetical protein n=1 Tax=Pseudoscardovia radai TaxID=987066 RepID=UPI003995439A